jgi:hypothetical protein
MSSIDEQFVEFIVKSLVGKPDEVKIDRTIDEKGVLLELTVDPEDLGRVIGKRGATAQSIRTLLRALGTKNDARYNLKIVDNGVPQPQRDAATSASQAAPSSDDTDDQQPTTDQDELVDEPVEEVVGITDDDDERESLSSRTLRELDDLDDLEV